MTRTDRLLRRLSIEPLERRQLLCGAAPSSSLLPAITHSALFATARSSSAVAVASNHHNSAGGGSATNETFLVTTLSDTSGTVTGTASFQTDANGNQKLVITVIGAAASATYSVSINGTDVGTTLSTDANGNGRLVLTSSSTTSSNIRSALGGKCGEEGATGGTLPAGFTLSAGNTIALTPSDTSLSTLTGTFAASTGNIGEGNGEGDDNGEGCQGGDQGATISRVVATLSDSATASGKAVFTTITHADGTTDEVLRIRVSGAAASTDLPIVIDDTPVGTLSTDANGNGYAIFSSNPKNSNVGQLPAGLSITPSAISVGTTITGTFGPSSTSGWSMSSAVAGRFSFRRR